jgi:hypothetical protein
MEGATTSHSLEPRPAGEQEITARVRRFSVRLAVAFIIGVNALFLLGLWASGLDLDKVFGDRDFFDPVRDVCLRLAWYTPAGEKDPVRLCKEWINLGDDSGKVHNNDKDMQIVKGADGKVYASAQNPGDGRVIALLLFIIAIVGAGMWLQRFLIARYRARLATTPEKNV